MLGLRNLQGCLDPPKLASQLLLCKSLLQLRRRLLQCCRPGGPDNIVKVSPRSTGREGSSLTDICRCNLIASALLCCPLQAFRYQRVVWPMPVASRPVDSADQCPPVERDEQLLPLWLSVSCWNAYSLLLYFIVFYFIYYIALYYSHT